MAGEPWNRVHVPFPGAVSSVRVPFNPDTDANVVALLVETEQCLKLIRSETLQTDVRVLYELLYILTNTFRGNKTFKALKQVEQCVNRLKNMKLDVALDELTDLCPNDIHRRLSIKTGVCEVPSQPMLEWLCLKVLGAAQLMSCAMTRCSTAFVLSRQQMKWQEFIILNTVIISMLSRLWVFFRGVLVSLSTLYQKLIQFLREVAHVQPMPYLTSFPLPADIPQFLGPSAALLIRKPRTGSPDEEDKDTQEQRNKSSIKGKQGQTGKVEEDLGVAIQRDIVHDTDMKLCLEIFRTFRTKKSHKADTKKQTFKKQLHEATSSADMSAHLEEMIAWCKSQRMKKEKRLLTFLCLKCNKMMSLEAAGYDVQRRLQRFRQEALWALSPQASAQRTRRSSFTQKRFPLRRIQFQSVRSRFKFSIIKTGIKNNVQKRRQRRRKLPVSGLSKDSQRCLTTRKAPTQTTDCDRNDDIDDIFASIGF